MPYEVISEQMFDRMLEEAAARESNMEIFALGCRMCGGMDYHETAGWEEIEELEAHTNRRERLKFDV